MESSKIVNVLVKPCPGGITADVTYSTGAPYDTRVTRVVPTKAAWLCLWDELQPSTTFPNVQPGVIVTSNALTPVPNGDVTWQTEATHAPQDNR